MPLLPFSLPDIALTLLLFFLHEFSFGDLHALHQLGFNPRTCLDTLPESPTKEEKEIQLAIMESDSKPVPIQRSSAASLRKEPIAAPRSKITSSYGDTEENVYNSKKPVVPEKPSPVRTSLSKLFLKNKKVAPHTDPSSRLRETSENVITIRKSEQVGPPPEISSTKPMDNNVALPSNNQNKPFEEIMSCEKAQPRKSNERALSDEVDSCDDLTGKKISKKFERASNVGDVFDTGSKSEFVLEFVKVNERVSKVESSSHEPNNNMDEEMVNEKVAICCKAGSLGSEGSSAENEVSNGAVKCEGLGERDDPRGKVPNEFLTTNADEGSPVPALSNGLSHINRIARVPQVEEADSSLVSADSLKKVMAEKELDESKEAKFQGMPQFGAYRKGFFRNSAFPSTEPSGVSDEHDSLNVDWQYQLPPPPSHFRDSTSPDVTEYETVTVGSELFPPRLELSKSPQLNGINEEESTAEEAKTSIDDSGISSDRSISDSDAKAEKEYIKTVNGFRDTVDSCIVKPAVVSGFGTADLSVNDKPTFVKKADVNGRKKGDSVRLDDNVIKNVYMNGRHENKVAKKSGLTDQKVLHSKTEVMLELTNVLAQQGMKEKSQSFSNLAVPFKEDRLKKSHTLSYSQSFMNAPLSNFKISNYDSDKRHPCTTDDFEGIFRKPAPVGKGNPIRRSDSINVTKKNSLDPETLQQEFLQFLQEKKLVDAGVQLEDLGMLPRKYVAKEKKVETVEEEKEKLVQKVEPIVNTVPVKVIEEEVKSSEELVQGGRKPSDPVVVEVVPKNALQEKAVVRVDNLKEEIKTIEPDICRENVKTVLIKASEPLIVTSNSEKFKDKGGNQTSVRRVPYQPPSISMSTWGERPKTTVIIKDSDYITQEDLFEKRPPPRTQNFESPKRLTEKKPVIMLKKPTNYELFSALPKKKDALIMAAMQNEEEVRRESAKLPVVCGVELKKEFRSEPDLIQGLKAEKNVTPPELFPQKTTSVYLNGYTKPKSNDVPIQAKVSTTMTRPNLMPVVKGFRDSSGGDVKSDSFKRQESLPAPSNKLYPFPRQESLPSKLNEPIRSQGIPPPPPIGAITLKPVSNRQMKPKLVEDPRGQLLEQIRGFGGLNRLKKTVQ